MSSILKIVAYAFLIIGIAYIIPGITIDQFWPTAVMVGLGFAIANALVRAVFSSSNIVFGIIALVLNGAAFWLLGQYVPGFDVQGSLFGSTALSSHMTALIGSVLASVGVYLINEVL